MPSTFPTSPDDLGAGNTGLTHGDVTDALAAVENVVLGLLAAPGTSILSGNGPPSSGSGLDPLNGVNDPWRWSAQSGQWVSAPVAVTWNAGATSTAFNAPSSGAWILIVQTGSKPGADAVLYVGNGAFNGAGVPAQPTTIAASGSGLACLSWQLPPGVAGFLGDNTDVLPSDARTIADVLGPDFTVTPAAWSEESIGAPGDYYYDINGGGFYGPRGVDGLWPYLATFGLSGESPQYIASGWTFAEPINAPGGVALTSPNGTAYRVVVADDGTLSTEAV